jgi:hypothetical protein
MASLLFFLASRVSPFANLQTRELLGGRTTPGPDALKSEMSIAFLKLPCPPVSIAPRDL